MKRLIPAFAIILGWAAAAVAATPGTLTSLRDIHLLTNAQASHALPVAFEATLTYFRSYEKTMFVQDGEVAIYVQATTNAKLVPGDRILIKGITHDSFRPYVSSNDITFLSHGTLPKPVPTTYDQLIRAQHDCGFVTVHAVIRAADLVLSSYVSSTSLQMYTDQGNVDAVVDSADLSALKGLLDAEVEVTGAASGRFDGKMQETGVLLHVASLADVKVLKRPGASPWSLPVTPMNEILMGYRVNNQTQRIRVQGTVTYYQPDAGLVLQNGPKSLWIMTRSRVPMRIGDVAEATGFPDLHDGFLTLTRGEIQGTNTRAPIVPQPATWHQLTLSHNIFDLVSIEGQVVMEVREAAQDEYVLVSEGQLFTAIYRHPAAISLVQAPLLPMKQIPLGSKVRVTGICILENSNPFDAEVPFNILMRDFDDIAVVARPSWVTVGNLTRVVSVLLLIVIAVGAWGWILKRKVRVQTAALAKGIETEAALERRTAQLEQRRSRILEDINGSRPLAEIIEQIAEMVSFMLDGAPCWCEIKDGARLGSYPPAGTGLRIARLDIPARSGTPLGVLFAGLDRDAPQGAVEWEALSAGIRLATLAIETRRLYSDLVHRSEFDLLTDIHNRFSLDKRLNALIEEARQNASIFGLIYIDLDDFKLVNDLYGHQVGDLYLQEVSMRMKRQLRSHDMLARLGGDEFAALVPVVRSRAEVEEIAQRLERSFDEHFAAEGYVLRGSASVGVALYPEDGATKDSLLSTADAAMYVAKHTKQRSAAVEAEHRERGLTPGDRT